MKTAVHAPMDTGVAKRYRGGRRTTNTFLFLLLLVLFFIVIIYLLFFHTTQSGYKAVKVSGEGFYTSYSKPYKSLVYTSRNQFRTAILMENGDILVAKDLLLPYQSKLYDSLHFSHINDSLVLVNNKVTAITINGRGDLLPWLQGMKNKDLDHLTTITINGSIPPTYYAYLKKIASAKPHTAIMFDPDAYISPSEQAYLLKIFSPTVLSVSLTDAQMPVLAGCWDLQTLILSGDSLYSPLPPLPSLRQCILTKEESMKNNKNFFVNNPQVEKLTTFSTVDLEYSKGLSSLQELHLLSEGEDTLDVASILRYHPGLTALTLSTRSRNIAALSGFKQLRWLGLPPNTTQEELNTVLPQLSNLEVLELTGSRSITSLAPLPALSSLQGLVIADTLTDLQSLLKCKQLNYLSLPDTVYRDAAKLAALQKALPRCMIVPNAGACLGSGWFLLVPLLVLAIIAFRSIKPSTYDTKA